MKSTESGSWEGAKLAFYRIPNDYIGVLSEYKKTHPERVKMDKQPKGTLYSVFYEPILGYDVIIDIHTFYDTSKDNKAQYMIFNDRENRCAVRRSWKENLDL